MLKYHKLKCTNCGSTRYHKDNNNDLKDIETVHIYAILDKFDGWWLSRELCIYCYILNGNKYEMG